MKVKANTAIIIARVSTEEQSREDHHSIPAQLKVCREYAERYGIEVVTEYPIPESAYQGERRKFKTAIKEAITLAEHESRPVALILFEIDRLTRRAISDVMIDIERAREAGKIEIHSALDNREFHRDSPPGDILQLRIQIDMAEHESRVKSRKIKESLKLRVSKGEYPNYAPLGY